MNISIGSSIRVTSKDRNSSKRAIISCINSNKTYDVIFENRLDSKDICEEEGVELNRITTLQDFELNADTSQDPTILKDNGNILFAFKDFESATLKYLESLKNLKSITNQIISIGSTVIVTPDIGKVVTDSQNLDEKNQKDKFAFKYGLVSDISPDGNVEVIYNDQLEELNIARRRIIKIYDDITSRELQRSLYSNLAKSSLQLVRYGWAVRYASIATAILEYTDENFHDIFTKNIANILFIRAKAYIGANKLSSALKYQLFKIRKDAYRLNEYDQNKYKIIFQEIETIKIKRKKQNKKLARDVAAWIETAMKISEEHKSKKFQNDTLFLEELDLDD